MSTDQPTDIAIARAASPKPVDAIAADLGIPPEALVAYGQDKAKVRLDYLASLEPREDGKLVLVTAVTPTPAGEGKTTTTIGLADALVRRGHKAAACLREPSLGPCFGMKGGGAGGGYSQVVPMEDINLHFTGDFHAVGAANNLLAALIDNHIAAGNTLGIDPRRIAWHRVVDMNDRALRHVLCSLGGVGNGFPREESFDITAASEVMAILCLARDLGDLKARLGRIVAARTRDGGPVFAHQLGADGAMAVLLKDAVMPNLVQTLAHTPAFVHGGPFANIAHGCNSLIATRAALKLARYVVTEAGFGADLGAEKFFDIKCRAAGLRPACAVMVATVRALKRHGGAASDDLHRENLAALRRGCSNLARHVRNVKAFGVPVVVAVNRFDSDSDAELDAVASAARALGTAAHVCTHWADGAAGADALAAEVVTLAESAHAQFAPLYDDHAPLWEKVKTVATRLYGASDIIADKKVRQRFRELQRAGYGHFPVCIAKTQYSFSTDRDLLGAPTEHVVPIREVRLAGGAEFVVVLCGDILLMPGLPRDPAARHIHLDDDGQVTGLY